MEIDKIVLAASQTELIDSMKKVPVKGLKRHAIK